MPPLDQLLCVLLVAAVVTRCTSSDREPLHSATAAACGAWDSAPPLRTADGRWLYIEPSATHETPHGLLVTGSPAILTSASGGLATVSPDRLAGALVAADSTSGLPSPAPDQRLLAPRSVPSSDGSIQLVWGESDDTLPYLPRVNRIRYARFQGRTWSPPETVIEAPNLAWVPSSPAAVAGDELVVAVSENDPRAPVIHVLRRSAAGNWTRSRIPIQPLVGALDLQLVALSRYAWLVAFVSADGSMAHDRNSLFVTGSRDGGRSWSAIRKLHAGGERGAVAPRLLNAGERGLLLWFEDPGEGMAPDSVRLAETTDSGRSWSSLPASPLPRGIASYGVAALGGMPHLALTSGDSVLHLVRRADGWHSCEPLRRSVPLGVALASRGDTLILVGGTRRAVGLRAEVASTIIARFH